MADIKLSIDDLPPAMSVYGADVFVIDQLGGDGYTKKLTYSTFASVLNSNLVLKSGDTMTGALILNVASPVSALQAAPKAYVDDQVDTKVSKSGDTMTGPLILNTSSPTDALQAASRGYVQNNFVPISGIGTGEQNTGMTGFLTLCAHPVSAFHAATKFYVDNRSGDGSPVGSIVYFAASAAPVGWLACNGAVLNKTIYQDLFNVIGYKFGGGGNLFNLPDLRGEFLRGWDAGKGTDPGRVFGTLQSDAFKSHTHTARLTNGWYYTNIGNGPNWSGDRNYGNNDIWPHVQIDATGGTETRPRNIALLPCIKYATNAEVNYLGLSAVNLLNIVNGLSSIDSETLAKAWVTFNGTLANPSAVGRSYNVSSVTKNSTGIYTITFTNPMSDANYSVVSTAKSALPSTNAFSTGENTRSTSSIQITTGTSSALADSSFVNVVIFGN